MGQAESSILCMGMNIDKHNSDKRGAYSKRCKIIWLSIMSLKILYFLLYAYSSHFLIFWTFVVEEFKRLDRWKMDYLHDFFNIAKNIEMCKMSIKSDISSFILKEFYVLKNVDLLWERILRELLLSIFDSDQSIFCENRILPCRVIVRSDRQMDN